MTDLSVVVTKVEILLANYMVLRIGGLTYCCKLSIVIRSPCRCRCSVHLQHHLHRRHPPDRAVAPPPSPHQFEQDLIDLPSSTIPGP